MLTSVLFVFYVAMAIGGYFMWRKTMQSQRGSVHQSAHVAQP